MVLAKDFLRASTAISTLIVMSNFTVRVLMSGLTQTHVQSWNKLAKYVMKQISARLGSTVGSPVKQIKNLKQNNVWISTARTMVRNSGGVRKIISSQLSTTTSRMACTVSRALRSLFQPIKQSAPLLITSNSRTRRLIVHISATPPIMKNTATSHSILQTIKRMLWLSSHQ